MSYNNTLSNKGDNEQMANAPLNIKLMNVNEFIFQNKCLPVTSILIKETSSTVFHHAGLFSEEIFGQIGSTDRLIKFGYIDLRTRIFHPVIYQALCKLKALYGEIMARKTYARFDDEIKDFVRSDENDEFANTGYKFFMDNFPSIKFVKNSSLTQNEKIDLIERYRNQLTISRCLVMPAGLRDMDIEDGKPETGSINKLYGSLINYSLAMPTSGSVSDIYDGVRFSIQKKVCEIYLYLFDMAEGKFGFFQRKYGSRNLALGTRNVISTANMAAKSPDDPQYLAMDEIKIPLFQGAKMLAPLIVYWMKSLFFNDIFNISSDRVALIDPKTYNLVYQPITEDEKGKFLSADGIEKIVNLFRDEEFRFTPCLVYNESDEPFYAFMVYDTGEDVYFTRSVSELQRQFKDNGVLFNKEKLRPITYAEMLYVATYLASRGKNATLTRYPAMEISSDVPCKIHLISTNPARKVRFVIGNDLSKAYVLPEYPIINTSFTDSTILHPQVLAGLGADFDGNCVVGSTTTNIKFSEKWLTDIKNSNYSVSGQHIDDIVNTILSKVYYKDNNWYYAEIRMDEFPQPGKYTFDKHGAKVYDIPDGCCVESFDNVNCIETYEPIKHITVENCCDTAIINLRSKSVQVSTNESVAVFDRHTGNIIRIKPEDCSNMTYVPVYKKSNKQFGSYGSFKDGWLLGSMLSDGWISDTYVGYAKNDVSTRSLVKDLIIEKTNCQHITTDIVDTNEEIDKCHKLGCSVRFKFAGKSVKDYIKSLDMYASDEHSFYTKRISDYALNNGTEDFLWGILSGLIEGDGTYRFADILQTKIDVRISTSSPYLMESIKHLCYRLGIRIAVSVTKPRNISKFDSFSIVLSSVDVCANASKLGFASPKYNTINYYVSECLYEEKRDQRDVIPITFDEGDYLRKISGVKGSTAFYTPVVMRSILLKMLPQMDQSLPLVKRILNNNVHWESVRSVIPATTERVYDFDVPSTKLYVVNDGVVTYDTVSVSAILSNEANKEVTDHLNSVQRYVHANGSLYLGLTDLVALTLYNLSRSPA